MTKTIGVFFGSRSPEHDVSIITGQLIISGLKKFSYKIIPVYLTKRGEWAINERLDSIKVFTAHSQDYFQQFTNYNLDLKNSQGKLVFKPQTILGKKIVVDVVFPAFHGQNGEDGTFQGVCEMFSVPYVGCDTASSAIAMDKVITKLLYQSANLPTTDFISLVRTDWYERRRDILAQINQLHWPLIVKPARLGSSIGISKTKNQKELEFAVEVALHYDDKVIVEDCIEDLIDITCCLIGNDFPVPSLLQESVFTSGFFSYEEKYLKGGGAQTGRATKSIIIPARLDKNTTKLIQQAAIQVFKLLGCSGIARVDFLYDKKTKKWFVNEVNTLPGTLYHHLWKQSGIGFEELLEKLIKFAEEKYQSKKQITYTFDSSILKTAASTKLSLKSL